MKDYVNFTHHYYKLDTRRYTTIRGVTAIKDYKKGNVIESQLKRNRLHDVLILRVKHRLFSSLSLKFLKKDAEYEGFVIYEKVDFLRLVNSFRRENRKITEEDPTFTVLWLERIVNKEDLKKEILKQYINYNVSKVCFIG